MIKCPFCLSPIPTEAKKCRHCGEWVIDKPNKDIFSSFSNLFSKSKELVKKQIDERKKKRYSHIFIPEDNKPLSINKTIFYGSYFVANGKKITYDKIISLCYSEFVMSINGMNEREIKFYIYLDIGASNFPIDDRLDNNVIDLSSSTFIFSRKKKLMEKTRFIYNILKEVTFKKRLALYQKMQTQLGFFYYPLGYRIYNNGDVEYGTKIRANVLTARRANLIEYGNYKRKGIKSSTSNPYAFVIHSNKGLKVNILGIGLYKNTTLLVKYDKDVFDYLIKV